MRKQFTAPFEHHRYNHCTQGSTFSRRRCHTFAPAALYSSRRPTHPASLRPLFTLHVQQQQLQGRLAEIQGTVKDDWLWVENVYIAHCHYFQPILHHIQQNHWITCCCCFYCCFPRRSSPDAVDKRWPPSSTHPMRILTHNKNFIELRKPHRAMNIYRVNDFISPAAALTPAEEYQQRQQWLMRLRIELPTPTLLSKCR